MIHWVAWKIVVVTGKGVVLGTKAAVAGTKAVAAKAAAIHAAGAGAGTAPVTFVPHTLAGNVQQGASSVLTPGHIARGFPAAAVPSGHFAAGGASTATPLVPRVVSQVAHSASSHAVSKLAEQAGSLAAKRVASGGTRAISSVGLRVIPLHVAPQGGLAASTGTALKAAGAIIGGPTAVEQLAKSFARGFVSETAKIELKGRVDLRTIKSWFAENSPRSKQAVKFTATGNVEGAIFRALPPRAGSSTVLQGFFDPKANRMIAGRIINGATSMSGTVLTNHQQTGIVVYA